VTCVYVSVCLLLSGCFSVWDFEWVCLLFVCVCECIYL